MTPLTCAPPQFTGDVLFEQDTKFPLVQSPGLQSTKSVRVENYSSLA